MSVIDTEQQKSLYNNIKFESENLLRLTSFIQNDFERMLEDAFTTPDAIKRDLMELHTGLNLTICRLEVLQSRVLELRKSYS